MRQTIETPDWPGAMRKTTAARYLELSVSEFDREVAAGRLPASFMLGRGEHWLKRAIDEALASMREDASPDWRMKLGLPSPQ
jgi:predicted DNA-binding transcriptional regulator AlpA